MRNTVQYLIEPLLTQFFLIDAICEGFLTEKQRETIFRELASVFCVPMDELALQYYETADSGVYKKIVDYAGYERLCRTIEFAQTSGDPGPETGIHADQVRIVSTEPESNR